MPLRPQVPAGLNLSRRVTTPVKLPKMTFPIGEGYPDPAGEASVPAEAGPGPEASMARLAIFQQPAAAPGPEPTAASMPLVPTAKAHQIIIYGRGGCEASIAAIQYLIDREMSFTYYDVGRDARALKQLQAICGDQPVVPVIVQVGFDGA